MKRLLTSAVALIMTAQFAQAEIWVCSLQQNAANGGWIPPTLVLGFEDGCNDVCVGLGNDGGVLQTDGFVATESAQRTTVAFRVELAQDSARQTANLAYRASLFRGRGTVTLSMTPMGYSNRFQASGTCAQQS